MSSKVKRLNESKRLEAISKLNQLNPPGKQSIARHYRVSEATNKKSGRSVKIFVSILL